LNHHASSVWQTSSPPQPTQTGIQIRAKPCRSPRSVSGSGSSHPVLRPGASSYSSSTLSLDRWHDPAEVPVPPQHKYIQGHYVCLPTWIPAEHRGAKQAGNLFRATNRPACWVLRLQIHINSTTSICIRNFPSNYIKCYKLKKTKMGGLRLP
jgi:hypothetical protein